MLIRILIEFKVLKFELVFNLFRSNAYRGFIPDFIRGLNLFFLFKVRRH